MEKKIIIRYFFTLIKFFADSNGIQKCKVQLFLDPRSGVIYRDNYIIWWCTKAYQIKGCLENTIYRDFTWGAKMKMKMKKKLVMKFTDESSVTF